jgi:hypothetical protein
VLSFVAKESVDLLIIGLYKANSRRKGLALKGNALALASRCAPARHAGLCLRKAGPCSVCQFLLCVVLLCWLGIGSPIECIGSGAVVQVCMLVPGGAHV